MDKLKLKYNSIANININYEFRVPEDLKWFVITRYKKINSKDYIEEQIIYNNGKIFFVSFSVIDNIKKDIYYNKIRREQIEKEFIYDLLNRLGINMFTLCVLESLKYNTNYLRKKYCLQLLINIKNKYILSNINEEEFIIKEKKSNNDLANVVIKDNKYKVDVKDNVDIMKLLKKFK